MPALALDEAAANEGGLPRAPSASGLDLLFLAAEAAEAPLPADLPDAALVVVLGGDAWMGVPPAVAGRRAAEGALAARFPEPGAPALTLLLGSAAAVEAQAADALGKAVRGVVQVGTFGAAAKARALLGLAFTAMREAADEVAQVAARVGIAEADMLDIVNASSGESYPAKLMARVRRQPGSNEAPLLAAMEARLGADLDAALALAEEAGVQALYGRRAAERRAIRGAE